MRKLAAGLFLVWVSLGAWGKAAGAGGEGVTIQFPRTATVVGPLMKLGEIAEVVGPNKVLGEKLRRLDLMKAPPAGQKFKVTQALVKIALRKEGYDLGSVAFEGSEAVEVLTESQQYSTDALLPQLRAFVLRGLPGEDPANVEVRSSGAKQKVTLPGGKVTATFRPPLSERYEGTLLVTTELEVDGRLARVLPIRVEVEVSRPVAVTTRNVQKGEKFDEKNMKLVRKPSSQIPPGALGDLDNILGRTASIFIPAGGVLRVQSLYDPPVVRQGQVLRALVERGNVEIEVDVRAVENGKAGEEIRVENTQTHKVLRAKVLNEKTVQIEEGRP